MVWCSGGGEGGENKKGKYWFLPRLGIYDMIFNLPSRYTIQARTHVLRYMSRVSHNLTLTYRIDKLIINKNRKIPQLIKILKMCYMYLILSPLTHRAQNPVGVSAPYVIPPS